MEWTYMLSGKEMTTGVLEFVGTDGRIKTMTIYAFSDSEGNPSYYDVAYNDKEEFENSDPKDWLDETKNPTKWLADEHRNGSFDDALAFVKKYVRDMGCDDTITNGDFYRRKVKGGERAFFIANGMVYSAVCKCVFINTADGNTRKHYDLWMKPDVGFTEDLLFTTKEDAETHLGDDRYDIGKIGLLGGEEIRNYFD